ncbi:MULTISPECIES: hypothetical protein [unclassified Thermoactinomyces]|uniref:hypothetical protein n=1 Tax=unclassified Thermoactinomyces TaxID=2634588 RepID=UPI0018DB727F|nr:MULTISPECIES: hypothetical protein [unclassified Thermoactinomyces]MBH8599067.1 hypothetical protein [Thermoactinomyces sp. CICC 10523]MBH8608002.1 hypothetical protein [Thermoactinomyces sp. CICC 10521]
MAKLFKAIVWILSIFVFLILIFGVYAIPLLPIYKHLGENVVANQIAGMNYMLTFLAMVGAVAGIGFTVFGYYESKKFPELIKQEIHSQLDEKARKVNELNVRINLLNDQVLEMYKTKKFDSLINL